MSILTKTKPAADPLVVVAGLPNVLEDPDLVVAADRYHQLQASEKRIIGELSTTGYLAPEGRSGPTLESDAEFLLQGGDVGSLGDKPSPEQGKARLLRQLAAVRAVLPAAQEAVRTTETRLIAETMARLKPLLQEVVGETLGAAEAFRAALEQQHKLFTLLDAKGITYPYRGGGVRLQPLEQVLLFGGALGPTGNLETYIRNRRESVGLPAEKEK